MRFLIALLALTASAQAQLATGVTVVGRAQYSIPLAVLSPPPPGATSLEIRIQGVNALLFQQYENLSQSPVSFQTDAQWGYGLSYQGATLVSDRMFAPVHTPSLSAWDGALDYSGSGGVTYQELAFKGETPWATIQGIPQTIDVFKRGAHSAPDNVDSNRGWSPTIIVEWRWW